MDSPYKILAGTISSVSQLNITFDTNSTIAMDDPQRNSSMSPKLSDSLSVYISAPLYLTIFLASVIGNTAVIVVMCRERKLRTVTNVLLVNLAVSDLLLTCLCLPTTLHSTWRRTFIFHEAGCRLLRFLQGLSVASSAFTLVAISIERYFAICRPLSSRRWQTIGHVKRVIVVCWACAVALMAPMLYHYKTFKTRYGSIKCYADWVWREWELAYTLIVHICLLLVPLLVMTFTYSSIANALSSGHQMAEGSRISRDVSLERDDISLRTRTPDNESIASDSPIRPLRHGVRVSYAHRSKRSLQTKRRVVVMLVVVVLEYFVCWTPSFAVNTWIAIHSESAFQQLSSLTLSLLRLLTFVSTCCNPITYCFMHNKFRHALLRLLPCVKSKKILRGRNSSRTTASTLY